MAYTGYLIIQYIDDNPLSSTYGETWTERVQSDSCQEGGDDNWVLVSSECEMVTSGFTGRRINTYYNDLLNEYSSTTVSDSGCLESAATWNDEEIWVNSGDPFCELDEDGLYTGRGIQIQQQKNFNLLNYGQTREIEVTLPDCSGYTQPQWEEISHQCHVVTDELTCYLKFDGTADILQIDVNPSSPTFNQTRTIQEESEDCYCEACDSIESEWRFVDRYCGNQVPSSYNLGGLTEDTIYSIYRRYDTCIVGGQSGRTTPTNIYSAQTYQTGVESCVYRWVETQETVCVEEVYNGKVQLTYSGGTTYSAACDSSTTLTQSDVRPSGYEHSAMTEAIIGSCITSIDNQSFIGSNNLTSVTIPDSVTSIGEHAFRECNNLPSIEIPDSVTSIGDSAFQDCTSLTSVNIPTVVTSINSSVFQNCPSLTGITIPNNVTSIGANAFYRCRSLTSITIPSSVTNIGRYAFYNCSNLTSITVNAITPPTLANANAFNGSTCPILVPCQSVDLYKAASNWSSLADRIQGIDCFDGKVKLTYSNGQTYSAACDSSTELLTGQTKPSGYEYSAMTKAVIGDCVTSIGSYAFNNCTSLRSVTIPDSVTNIGSTAFGSCSGLTSISIPATVTSIGDYAFQACSSLTSATISNGVISIGESAFWECTGLTSIEIPSSVTSISNGAFYGCSGLTSVTINATTPPALPGRDGYASAAFSSTNNCPIFVPSGSVETFKNASEWSHLSSRIQAIPT